MLHWNNLLWLVKITLMIAAANQSVLFQSSLAMLLKILLMTSAPGSYWQTPRSIFAAMFYTRCIDTRAYLYVVM